jgi:hypothetical protein
MGNQDSPAPLSNQETAMRRLVLHAAIASLLVLLGPDLARAQFPLATYENWRNPDGTPDPLIRGDRWVGTGSGALEATREIRVTPAGVPALFLRTRQEGQTTDSEGFTFFASNGLRFRHPETITRVQATFKVLQLHLDSHCPANTTNTTEAQAEIFWVGFNDGSSTGPGDRTGDHQFQIRARRLVNTLDPPGVMQVRASVCRCPNATCSGALTCTSAVLPSVQTGKKFKLRAIHDRDGAPGAKFRVRVVGAGSEQLLGYPADTPPAPSHNPAVNSFGYVNAGGLVPDCATASGGPKEFDITVQVHDVKTNPEAVVP